MPQEDATVLLRDGPHPQAMRTVRPLLVGNALVPPLGSPDPPMERALDAVTSDPPAVADVCPEMRTMALQHVQVALLVAIGDEFLAEVAQRPHLTLLELSR